MSARLKQIEAYFLGRLDAQQIQALFEGLATDPAGRRQFEQLMGLERALCGLPADGPAWSHFDAERIEGLVLHRAGILQPQAEPWWAWLFAFKRLAPVLALLLLVVGPLVWWLQRPPAELQIPSSMFAPRGVVTPYQTHLFLFCVEGEGHDTKVTRLDRPPFMTGIDRCPVSAEFQFAVTNLGMDKRYLAVAGLDDQGQRLWYFPIPGEGGSPRVETAVAERLYGESVRLSVNHRSGRARIFAIFSELPVTGAELDRALEGAKGQPERMVLPLERDDVYQEGFEIELTDQGRTP